MESNEERRAIVCRGPEICRDAADQAVHKVFAILGVNVDDPASVAEFQEDLRFGKKMRKIADKSLFVVVTVIITGIVYALWTGVLEIVKPP